MRAIATDHYEALGVRPDADHHEIRSAYLERMRASHPDHRPGDPEAASRARAANAAWDVLGDPPRRVAYDRLRTVREAGETRRHGGPATRWGDTNLDLVAYSPERERYRRDVTHALLRFAVGAFVAGLLLLLAFA